MRSTPGRGLVTQTFFLKSLAASVAPTVSVAGFHGLTSSSVALELRHQLCDLVARRRAEEIDRVELARPFADAAESLGTPRPADCGSASARPEALALRRDRRCQRSSSSDASLRSSTKILRARVPKCRDDVVLCRLLRRLPDEHHRLAAAGDDVGLEPLQVLAGFVDSGIAQAEFFSSTAPIRWSRRQTLTRAGACLDGSW